MDFQFYNRANTNSYIAATPAITFYSKGPLRINSAAAQLLNLQSGQGLELVFNAKEKQWYACKSLNPDAFLVRQYKDDSSLQFNASSIAKMILNAFEPGKSGSSVKAIVSKTFLTHANGNNTIHLYPLLMKPKPVRP